MAPKTFHPLIIALLGTIMAATLQAQERSVDKSQFNLFRPTPRDLMRELSTDRPDRTESAYTVDAGHFQIESDLAIFALDRFNGDPTDTQTATWAIAVSNFKVGLLNNVDLQLVVPTFVRVRSDDRDADFAQTSSGFGDLVARLKINLWGNDGGKTAFALMPFGKFPTAQHDLGNGSFEGGVILPLAIALPCEWQMGVMTVVGFNKESSEDDFHTEFVNSITVSHAIVGELSGYIEFFSLVSSEEASQWTGTIDLGVTYGLTKDIQLDAGVNIGVTRAAEDINPFIGATWRF